MADKTEKAEKTDGAAAGAKKGPPMMIIMAVFAVIVLGGAFMMVQKAGAKQKAGAEVKKVEKGPVMTLDEFLVNLSDPGSDHFLKVTVGLELDKAKGKTAEGLKEETPAIRDAVLTALSSQTRDEVTPIKGRENLKAQIKKNVNEALGEDDVQSVYFTNFVTQ